MNTEGVTLPTTPDPSKANPKDLMAEISKLNQQLLRERQEATRKLTESLAKSKAELDRLRQTTYQHGKDLENQNSALLLSLGRLKEERDQLQQTVYQLQAQLQARGPEIPRAQAQPVDGGPTSTVQLMPQTTPLGGEEIPIPPRS
jgi:septal ring factor EnvC (AmiA/AmiB activator)